jgi:hypothetical protein
METDRRPSIADAIVDESQHKSPRSRLLNRQPHHLNVALSLTLEVLDHAKPWLSRHSKKRD